MNYDITALQRLVDSGLQPDDTQILELHELAAKDVSLISSLEEEEMQALEKLKEIQKRVEIEKALLSPVLRLPGEIWMAIFLESVLKLEKFVTPHRDSPPLVFCQLNRFIRYLALGTPQLWSSIKIRRCDWKLKCHPRVDFVQLWLSRAAKQPLSIYFSSTRDKPHKLFECDVKCVVDIMDFILMLTPRWKSVHFCASDLSSAVIRLGAKKKTGSTILEDFELDIREKDKGSYANHAFLGKLRSLWKPTQGPIRFYLDRIAGDNFFRLLRDASSASQLHVCSIFAKPTRSVVKSPFRHAQLTVLKIGLLSSAGSMIYHPICLGDVLGYLTLPALRTLHIEGFMYWDTQLFTAFLTRSSCAIEDFAFYGTPNNPSMFLSYNAINESIIHSLRQMSRSLVRLRLYALPTGPTPCLRSDTLRAMSYGAPGRQICPLLETIETTDYLISSDDGLFSEMIKSRLEGPGCHILKNVHLQLHSECKPMEKHGWDIACLESLRDKGLQFTYDVVEKVEAEADFRYINLM